MEQQARALTAMAIGAAITVAMTLLAVAGGLYIQMFGPAAPLLITIMAQVLHLTMTAAHCQAHLVALAQASAGCLARRVR